MSKIMTPKTLTIRLNPELYSAVQNMAQRRAMSLNNFLQEGLAAAVRADEESQRYHDYSLLGQEAEVMLSAETA